MRKNYLNIYMLSFCIFSILSCQNENSYSENTYLELYDIANKLLEEGEYKKAINNYNKSIYIKPFDKSYFNRGKANIYLRKYDEAIYDFAKSIEFDYGNFYFVDDFYKNLTDTLNFEANFKYKINQAKKKYLDKNPQFLYYYEAIKINYDKTIKDDNMKLSSVSMKLDQSILIDSMYSPALRFRGITMFKENEKFYSSAVKELKKASEIEPKNYNNYKLLGDIYRRLSNSTKKWDGTNLTPTDSNFLNKTIFYYEKWFKLFSIENIFKYAKSGEYQYEDLIEFYSFVNNDDKKLNCLNNLIKVRKIYEKNPGYYISQNYISRAKLFLNKNKYSNALKDLSKAISYDSSNSKPYVERANLHKKLDNLPDQKKDLSKAIEICNLKERNVDWLITDLYLDRAINKILTKDYQGAYDDADSSINYNEKDYLYNNGFLSPRGYIVRSEALDLLGYCLETLKDLQIAKNIFIKNKNKVSSYVIKRLEKGCDQNENLKNDNFKNKKVTFLDGQTMELEGFFNGFRKTVIEKNQENIYKNNGKDFCFCILEKLSKKYSLSEFGFKLAGSQKLSDNKSELAYNMFKNAKFKETVNECMKIPDFFNANSKFDLSPESFKVLKKQCKDQLKKDLPYSEYNDLLRYYNLDNYCECFLNKIYEKYTISEFQNLNNSASSNELKVLEKIQENCFLSSIKTKKIDNNNNFNSSIIIGSFGSKTNAEKQKQKLVSVGFDNINISKVGKVFKVSILVSGTKDQCQKILKKVKVYHKSAWISYN